LARVIGLLSAATRAGDGSDDAISRASRAAICRAAGRDLAIRREFCSALAPAQKTEWPGEC